MPAIAIDKDAKSQDYSKLDERPATVHADPHAWTPEQRERITDNAWGTLAKILERRNPGTRWVVSKPESA